MQYRTNQCLAAILLLSGLHACNACSSDPPKHDRPECNGNYYKNECCPNDVTLDLKGLIGNFDANIHGQHLVKDVVVHALNSHFSIREPRKALVMSFHGDTGTGKNFAATFITNSIHKLGMKSAFVHLFSSTLHFPHQSQLETYKRQIQNWIRGNVTKCGRSVFIFDEIDKSPDGFLDVIKPFVDFYVEISGLDFRKAVFIFLSNTGATKINQKMLERHQEGKRREKITYYELEDLLEFGSFDENGGLHSSDLIHHSLVDVYVPFLPMTRQHVEKCIRDEFLRRKHQPTKELIKRVLHQIDFYLDIFSTTGCKRVYHKVGYVIAEDNQDNNF